MQILPIWIFQSANGAHRSEEVIYLYKVHIPHNVFREVICSKANILSWGTYFMLGADKRVLPKFAKFISDQCTGYKELHRIYGLVPGEEKEYIYDNFICTKIHCSFDVKTVDPAVVVLTGEKLSSLDIILLSSKTNIRMHMKLLIFKVHVCIQHV